MRWADVSQQVGAFLEKYPAAAVGVACVLIAFFVGRCSVGVRVRVETKTVEVEKVRTVEVEKQVLVAARASSGGTVVHRVVERIARPGGETVERTTEDVREGHQAQEEVAATHEHAAERVEYRERVVEKVVEKSAARPQWRAGVLAGLDVPRALRSGLGAPPWAFGGLVERRVLGPFSVGLWGVSTGAGGLVATVEW